MEEKVTNKIVKSALLLSTCAAVVIMWASLAGAAEDDPVEGLWLQVPDFPADAVDMGFSQNDEGVVAYSRMTPDGMAVLVIERLKSTGEDGETVTPEGIPAFVAWIESIPESAVEASEDGELAALLSYPVVGAEYMTGENEDTRINRDLYVFTDGWLFRVKASLSADFAEDFVDGPDGGELGRWLRGMRFRD
jgi:hypothetical protein